MEAEAPLSGDSGVLRGQGTPRALSRRDRAPGPRESPRVISGTRHSGCCSLARLLPWGQVLLAGPKFPSGEFPLRTPRIGVLHFLHGERLWSSGRLRLKGSHSVIKWFSTDFTDLKLWGPSEHPRGRVGKCLPKLDFCHQGQPWPDSPPGEYVWGPVPDTRTHCIWGGTMAGTPCWPRVPSSSLGTLPLRRWQTFLNVWVRENSAVLWVTGRGSSSMDTT